MNITTILIGAIFTGILGLYTDEDSFVSVSLMLLIIAISLKVGV